MTMPRGRPKALSMGRAAHKSQRNFDDLLWDVMQTCLRHDLTASARELVWWMQRDFPDQYGSIPFRTVRRDVTKAMHWAASRLYRLPLFKNEAMLGFNEAIGFFDEATIDKAVATAQARPTKLNEDQLKKTLWRICELLRQNPDGWPNSVARIVGPKK
jgi:hypothetical protein